MKSSAWNACNSFLKYSFLQTTVALKLRTGREPAVSSFEKSTLIYNHRTNQCKTLWVLLKTRFCTRSNDGALTLNSWTIPRKSFFGNVKFHSCCSVKKRETWQLNKEMCLQLVLIFPFFASEHFAFETKPEDWANIFLSRIQQYFSWHCFQKLRYGTAVSVFNRSRATPISIHSVLLQNTNTYTVDQFPTDLCWVETFQIYMIAYLCYFKHSYPIMSSPQSRWTFVVFFALVPAQKFARFEWSWTVFRMLYSSSWFVQLG